MLECAPVARRRLVQALLGSTILLAANASLSSVQAADPIRIAVIADGKVVATGAPAELIGSGSLEDLILALGAR